LANSGTITTLTNTGTISNGSPGADAILSEGVNASIGTLTNNGQIVGAVALLDASGDALDNLGRISGDVGLAGGDILMNQGQLYGDVTLGASDSLTDTGLIQGGVTLGAADTLDVSGGEVGGAITASSGDLIEFSGSFGHETIDNFTATGAAHDTLELGSAGFAGSAMLSSSMEQVGSNVVIGLGANSVTLADVSLSSLVSADFKFA
jgi:serralysin